MSGFSLAAAAAEGGNPVVGFCVLAGMAWFFVWLFSSKPKSYTINSRTTGTIRPN